MIKLMTFFFFACLLLLQRLARYHMLEKTFISEVLKALYTAPLPTSFYHPAHL